MSGSQPPGFWLVQKLVRPRAAASAAAAATTVALAELISEVPMFMG
ncbi:hypothetical protein [Amycolatopsis jiangsuensis]|nr:hypothetical protein [Amycolatopsis jiangsuensis]